MNSRLLSAALSAVLLTQTLATTAAAQDGPRGAPTFSPTFSPTLSPTKPVPVRVDVPSADLVVHVRTGQGQVSASGSTFDGRRFGVVHVDGQSTNYAPLCSSPCVAELLPGRHRLGIAASGGAVVEAEDPVDILGPSIVSASYEKRDGQRVVGYLLLTFGDAAGGVLLLAGAKQRDQTLTTAGVAAGAVLGLPGLVLTTLGDRAVFRVTPLALAPLAPREGQGAPGASSGLLPNGLALVGTF
jgi:hypothetical protein